MGIFKDGKVKRVHSACCGMENGKVYEARVGTAYVDVKLDDGTWVCDHWAGFGSEDPFFEVIEQGEEWKDSLPKE